MLTLLNPQRVYHVQMDLFPTNYNHQAVPVAMRENIGKLLEPVCHVRKDIIEIQTTTKPAVKVATQVNIKTTKNKYFVLIVCLANTNLIPPNRNANLVKQIRFKTIQEQQTVNLVHHRVQQAAKPVKLLAHYVQQVMKEHPVQFVQQDGFEAMKIKFAPNVYLENTHQPMDNRSV